MVEKGPRWSEMFWDGQRLSEIFLIWSVDIMRGSRMVQDFQDALKWEEMNIASTRPERRRREGRRQKAYTSDHPPLLYDQIIFFVLCSFEFSNLSNVQILLFGHVDQVFHKFCVCVCVWRVSGGCLGGCLGVVWRVSGGCLEDVWKVAEGCLEGSRVVVRG